MPGCKIYHSQNQDILGLSSRASITFPAEKPRDWVYPTPNAASARWVLPYGTTQATPFTEMRVDNR